jgi:dienelactone hydrolase
MSVPRWLTRIDARCQGMVIALSVACALLAPAAGQAQLGFGAKELPAGAFQFDGKAIDYWQFEPREKGKGPLPAVLVLHGIEGLDAVVNNNQFDKEIQNTYKWICKSIAEKGYVVRFVHYMQGTQVAKGQVNALQQQIKDSLVAPPDKVDPGVEKLFKQWMNCVKAGMEDLTKNAAKNNIDPERVGAVGISMGGFVVASLAVTEPKFSPQALVIVCGGLPELLHAKVNKLPPVLLICGAKDEIVPVAHTRKVCDCLEKKDCSVVLLQFPCYHMFLDDTVARNGKFQLELAQTAQDFAEAFLRRHVKNAPKGQRAKD